MWIKTRGYYYNRLGEAFLMNSHNGDSYGEERKIIPNLHVPPNTHLISCYACSKKKKKHSKHILLMANLQHHIFFVTLLVQQMPAVKKATVLIAEYTVIFFFFFLIIQSDVALHTLVHFNTSSSRKHAYMMLTPQTPFLY